MKLTVPTTIQRDGAAIRCALPNRYHDEPEDQFLSWPDGAGYDRVKHVLTLVLDLDSRKVEGWPAGVTAEANLKVCDEGTYELLDTMHQVIATLREEYIPSCVPGEDGDYFVLQIGPDGSIAGWRPTALDVVRDFWPSSSGR